VSGGVGSMGGLCVAAGRRAVSQQQQQRAQSLRARQWHLAACTDPPTPTQ